MRKSDLLAAYFTKRGLREVNGRTQKYRVFARPDGKFWFIGKNGALRFGRTVSDSISLSPKWEKIEKDILAV